MAKVQGNILYKIYYEFGLVYLGRTKQPLQDRIRGHLFKKPMHRSIDINLVTKVEYAEFAMEADMFLYEVYYINTLKPPLNVDDRARDNITVTLPDVEFKEFVTHLWDGWKDQLKNRDSVLTSEWEKWRIYREELSILRGKYKAGEISREEFDLEYDKMHNEHEALEKKLFKTS